MKFAVLGAKLGHSLSPQIHTELYKMLGIQAEYGLVEVPPEELGPKIAQLQQNYRGINITIPHKVAAMEATTYIAPEARAIGAINTISFEGKEVKGYNTDYYGFGRLLSHNGLEPTGRVVAVLGTGGASRAILQYLKDQGAAKVILVTRQVEKAPADLAAKYGTPITYEQLRQVQGDIIVNCTPVGMYPKVEASPADGQIMSSFKAAVDIVYNPAVTRFMQLALDQGKPAVNGLFMLVAQAVAAEEIWLGQAIDTGVIAEITNRLELDLRAK